MKRRPWRRDRGHGVHRVERTRLVGLDGQAEPAPGGEAGGDAFGQRVQQVERQLQAVALFGIDRQVELGLRGHVDQLPHARQQFGEHALALRLFVA